MKFLFYDTETTGLIAEYGPTAEWEKFPRMVSIGMCLFDDEKDYSQERLPLYEFLVKPEGYAIPEEATAVHGITTERAMSEGYDVRFVLGMFFGLQSEANCIVGHNVSFDGKIVRADCNRVGLNLPLTKMPTIDTMHSSRKFCGFKDKNGRANRAMKLEELYEKLFNKPMMNAHSATGDLAATIECYQKLKGIGVISQSTWETAVEKHAKIQKAVEAKAIRLAEEQF